MRRSAVLLFGIAACIVSPFALAQVRTPPADAASATTANEAPDDATRQEPSAFGQVMGMLTLLLQEAANKQATTNGAIAPTLSPEQSAVTVRVTPVAGSSTFYARKPRADAAAPCAVRRTRRRAGRATGGAGAGAAATDAGVRRGCTISAFHLSRDHATSTLALHAASLWRCLPPQPSRFSSVLRLANGLPVAAAGASSAAAALTPVWSM